MSALAVSLLHAAASGDETTVSALLHDGVNPNTQDEVRARGSTGGAPPPSLPPPPILCVSVGQMGWNPLMRAVNGGHNAIAEMLLTAKSPSSVRVANKVGLIWGLCVMGLGHQ